MFHDFLTTVGENEIFYAIKQFSTGIFWPVFALPKFLFLSSISLVIWICEKWKIRKCRWAKNFSFFSDLIFKNCYFDSKNDNRNRASVCYSWYECFNFCSLKIQRHWWINEKMRNPYCYKRQFIIKSRQNPKEHCKRRRSVGTFQRGTKC